MWNASVALCRPGAPAANVACGPAQASHRQVNQHQGHRCSQWPAGTREHHATVRVPPTLRTWANMTVWPSGLRRWLQAPVRKGVGSNPTAVISSEEVAARHPATHIFNVESICYTSCMGNQFCGGRLHRCQRCAPGANLGWWLWEEDAVVLAAFKCVCV